MTFRDPRGVSAPCFAGLVAKPGNGLAVTAERVRDNGVGTAGTTWLSLASWITGEVLMPDPVTLVAPAFNILTKIYGLLRGNKAVTRDDLQRAVQKAVRSEIQQHPAFRGTAAAEATFYEAVLTATVLAFVAGGTTDLWASTTSDGFHLRIDHKPLPSHEVLSERLNRTIQQLPAPPPSRQLPSTSSSGMIAAKNMLDAVLRQGESSTTSKRNDFISRHNEAQNILDAGNPARAVLLFDALVPEIIASLGPTDRVTLIAREVQARACGEAGDRARALRLYADLVPEMSRVLGPSDRATLIGRINQADNIGHAGDPKQAVRIYADVLPTMRRVLGTKDNSTKIAEENKRFWVLKSLFSGF